VKTGIKFLHSGEVGAEKSLVTSWAAQVPVLKIIITLTPVVVVTEKFPIDISREPEIYFAGPPTCLATEQFLIKEHNKVGIKRKAWTGAARCTGRDNLRRGRYQECTQEFWINSSSETISDIVGR
jgi:hypothetical protein